MHLTLLTTFLTTLAAALVHARTTSDAYGLRARDFDDDNNSLFLERDDDLDNLLSERDAFYDKALDNFLVHARDLGSLLEARDAHAAARKLYSREIRANLCAYGCGAIVRADPTKQMRKTCPSCGKAHKMGRSGLWVKM